MPTDLNPGEIVYTIGLDMQCREVVCRRLFVGVHADGRPIVQGKDGIRVIYDWGMIYKSRQDALRSIGQ